MASLIKNQILKHLSKFTKNLSPDKINLSTLRGEGEMSNLELDETVLTELLELPTWLRLTKAVCNRVSVKIQWTKLKSQPICLLLDEVLLEIETCDEPRPYNNGPSEQSSYRSGGKYGFSDKVIDGMSVAINSVNVNFLSKTFSASLQLSRVQVYSVNPNWQKATDLRLTRIKDMDKGEILLFKEVDWQTTRIEANGVNLSDATTPLRLIANQSKIRITLKKKLSDCSIVSSRVMFLLDDLLWVLTDTQLKAAILYTNSLKEAIEKSSQQSKKMAAEKLKKQGHMGPTADQLRHQLKQQQSVPTTAAAKFFAKYDVVTTSYHLITSRIDLHLCDDAMPNTDGQTHKRAVEGGAMQITLQKLSVDYYPYHPAGGERKSWYRYADNLGSRNHWVQQLFATFKEDVKTSRETCNQKARETATSTKSHDHQDTQSPHPSPSKQPQHLSDQVHYSKADGHTHLAPPAGHGHRHGESKGQRSEGGGHRSDVGHIHAGGQGYGGGKGQAGGHNVQTDKGNPRQTKLLESCFVLKMEEVTIFRVSTPNNRKGSVKKFLCSDKKQLHLPPDMSVIQLEFTEYYFTEGIDYPGRVPHANLYILVNPIRLTVDYTTILWANYFFLNLAQGVKLEDLESQGPTSHIDIKLEAVMPRVVIPSENRVPGQIDRPDAIQIQVSRLTATNSRVESKSSRTDLQKLLTNCNNASLFSSMDFPNDQNPFVSIPQQFCDHASNQDNPYIDRATKSLLQGDSREANPQLHVNTLRQDAAFDIWSIIMDQIWVEFTGVPSCMGRPAPFLESIPLTIWFCNPLAMRQSGEGQSEQKTQLDVSIELGARDEIFFGSPRRENGITEKESPRPSKKLLSRQHYTVCDDTGNISDSVEVKPPYSSHSNISQPPSCHGNSNHINDVSIDLSPNTQSPQLADIYLVVNFGGKLRAEINHYQYLFLMRILDSYSDFQTMLNEDMEFLMPGSSASTEKICASMVLQELEFAMVCPAIPQPSVTPSSQTFSSPLTMMPELARLGESMDSRTGVELHVPSRDLTDDSGSGASTNLLGSSPSRGTAASILMPKPSGEAGSLQLGVMTHGRGGSDPTFDRRDSVSGAQPSGETDGVHNAPSIESSNKGARPPLKRTSSTAEVKKSLTSAWTAFSEKLKSRGDISDDSSSLYSEEYDSMSINTDMSSDDEFEFLGLDDSNEAPAFEHHGNIGLPPEAPSTTETSETPDEMPMVGISRELLLSEKAKEHVSVIVFKLNAPELLLQSIGPDVIVRVQLKHLSVHESGNTIYEDFYSKFSSTRGYVPVNEDFEPHSPIKLKYMVGSGIEPPMTTSVGEAGFLDLRCQGLKLGLSMSSITHMADLIEDEIIPKPMPMSLQLADLHLHLKEDRPPNNFTSPGSVPLDVHISQMTISRGEDGVFQMKGEPIIGVPPTSHDLTVPLISQDKLSSVHQIPDVCLNEHLSGRPRSPRELHMSELDLSNMKLEVERLTQQNIHLNQQLSENMSQMDLNRKELEETKAENKELRKQLQKIANFQQDESGRLQGGNSGLDRSKGSNIHYDQSQGSNSGSNHTKGGNFQSDFFGGGTSELSTQLDPLEQENNNLLERISDLEDELRSSKKEKDSLVATLRLLQEELLTSESKRNTRQRSPRR